MSASKNTHLEYWTRVQHDIFVAVTPSSGRPGRWDGRGQHAVERRRGGCRQGWGGFSGQSCSPGSPQGCQAASGSIMSS